MHLPETDYQILKLTDQFYQAYPDPPYHEILQKRQRAYNCLLFQTHYHYFICIPYRSEINHSYAYHFKGTSRSAHHHSGLDYTKIIIIDNLNHIEKEEAIIDKDEYNETIKNLEEIKKDALQYVEDYIACQKKEKIMHPREFKRRYQFSTLPYFHKQLGLEHKI